MPTTLLDTGLIYAMFDRRDRHYADAEPYVALLESARIVLLWPILYEALNTRFVRRSDWLTAFRAFADRSNVTLMDDAPYRLAALDELYRMSQLGCSVSLVDSILRSFMQDPSVRVDVLLTFNHADFADVCRRRSIRMPPFPA